MLRQVSLDSTVKLALSTIICYNRLTTENY